jgi:hypothetical protein
MKENTQMDKPKLIALLNPELETLDGGKKVKEVRAIVNHWTAAGGQKEIDTLRYCIYNSLHLYHYFIGFDGTIYAGTKYPLRASHCGANVYRQEAITRFPDYCPTTDHRVIPHKVTPNSVTMSVCTAVLDEVDGTMTPETYNSLTLINAKMIHDLNPKLDPFKDTLVHSFFTDEKQCHKFFVKYPDKFATFKQDIKHILDIYSDDLIAIVKDYGYIVPKSGSSFEKKIIELA